MGKVELRCAGSTLRLHHGYCSTSLLLLLLLTIALSGCGPGKAPPVAGNQAANSGQQGPVLPAPDPAPPKIGPFQFAERASASGVDFTYRNGEEAGHAAILESMGGGAALFDYDLDADLDLFFPGGGRFGSGEEILALEAGLFRNDAPWQFAEVSALAGLRPARHYSEGVAVADYDNDGFPDLLVTGYGGLQLFHNQGDGTFEDATDAAGLVDPLWSTSAAWGDLNGDGQLDLYVAHYVDWSFQNDPVCRGPKPGQREVCPPRKFSPLPDVVYLSNGDGTFEDASAAVGLRADGKGLGVTIADFDLDGDADVYVANDTVPNFLYRNGGSGHFEEIGAASGTALSDRGMPDGSMGVAVGDFDLDGLPDLGVANYETETFALYRNEGKCSFQHVSRSAGVTAVGTAYVSFGVVFLDADRDGDEDLFVSNGHVLRFPEGAPLRQVPFLFENRQGRFANVAAGAGPYMATPHMGRGSAAGDLDGDGDLDLVVAHTQEPHALLENETPNDNGWLSVRLIGTASSRDPIGAQLSLETSAGPRVRQVVGGGSYLSHSDVRAFWGLPQGVEIQGLTIRWPSGTVQKLTSVPANQVLTLVEPARAGQE